MDPTVVDAVIFRARRCYGRDVPYAGANSRTALPPFLPRDGHDPATHEAAIDSTLPGSVRTLG